MESGQHRFGMMLGGDYSDYGTILEINHFEQLPDGRSIVMCTGGSRFKVIELRERDG
jgi:Lon protease-like protein